MAIHGGAAEVLGGAGDSIACDGGLPRAIWSSGEAGCGERHFPYVVSVKQLKLSDFEFEGTQHKRAYFNGWMEYVSIKKRVL